MEKVKQESKVTAYEVTGDVDYKKLVDEFGISLIDDKLLSKIKNLHPLLKRKYFFGHRDFDKVLDYYSKGNKFAIVSGRGPSEKMHLAHLLLYRFNKYLQDEFGCYYFFPFSDDEKYLFKQGITFEEVEKYAYENALDVAALGFDPDKTEFVFDLKYMKQDLYNLSIKCAKRLTFNKVKSAFGFTDSTNIGISFYPAMQAAHILYPTVKYNLPSLVTVAVDQDVFIKLTRDIAAQLKVPKCAALITRFMKGLAGDAKMSASKESSALYTTDSPAEIKRKIMGAFTGGRATVAEQREKGANPDICSVYEYLTLFFLDKEEDVEKLTTECKTGKLLCGQCKNRLCKFVTEFLAEHNQNREKARKNLNKFFKGPDFVPKL